MHDTTTLPALFCGFGGLQLLFLSPQALNLKINLLGFPFQLAAIAPYLLAICRKGGRVISHVATCAAERSRTHRWLTAFLPSGSDQARIQTCIFQLRVVMNSGGCRFSPLNSHASCQQVFEEGVSAKRGGCECDVGGGEAISIRPPPGC